MKIPFRPESVIADYGCVIKPPEGERHEMGNPASV